MSQPTTIRRSDDEVVAKIRSLEDGIADFFGAVHSDLIETLPFEAASPFLIPEAIADDWSPAGRDDVSVVERIRDYLSFAWDKANDCRGLSAGRSICHMQAWLWLLGEDEAAKQIEDYDLYGKPQLRAISEAVGVDWTSLDNGEWTNDEGSSGSGPDSVAPLKLNFVGALANGAFQAASSEKAA
ncbi:hypothetical protein [Methylobacterium bullatum]|uniref:Uncharacterized protein n=1 Tax=Methylobacterium bullatum TaxID=570505 RepID=A0AAV4ZCU0_9HYPH|nr:hypothetical protein [Methylobacterium bullatum]GJD41350.1 hypothetical protein OICFNHDK_3833 [Methylobacterium bullatum]